MFLHKFRSKPRVATSRSVGMGIMAEWALAATSLAALMAILVNLLITKRLLKKIEAVKLFADDESAAQKVNIRRLEMQLDYWRTNIAAQVSAIEASIEAIQEAKDSLHALYRFSVISLEPVDNKTIELLREKSKRFQATYVHLSSKLPHYTLDDIHNAKNEFMELVSAIEHQESVIRVTPSPTDNQRNQRVFRCLDRSQKKLQSFLGEKQSELLGITHGNKEDTMVGR